MRVRRKAPLFAGWSCGPVKVRSNTIPGEHLNMREKETLIWSFAFVTVHTNTTSPDPKEISHHGFMTASSHSIQILS